MGVFQLPIPKYLIFIKCIASHFICHALVLLLQNHGQGGKGGFGSILKNEAQTRRKITNWDHSRELDGKRIGNANNEKRLVEFYKQRKSER